MVYHLITACKQQRLATMLQSIIYVGGETDKRTSFIF